jgi:hypothetical protein
MAGSVGRLRPGVPDGLQEPSVIEPIDPFQGGELDGLEASPWPAPADADGMTKQTIQQISEPSR